MQNSFKDFRETFSHRNWTIVNLISRSILLVKGAHIATFPQAWPCINGYAVVYKISKWNCQCLTGNSKSPWRYFIWSSALLRIQRIYQFLDVAHFYMAEGELQKITSQTNFIDFKEGKACSDKIEK